MQNHILEVDSVSKSFSNRPILSDVWLRIATGSVTGLLGRNGSGKSTLLRIVAGHLAADHMFLKIDGKPVSTAKGQLAYLSQDNFIPKHFSVGKAIRLSLDKAEADVFCKDDVIRSALSQKVGNLSTGQRRYFEIRLLLFHSAHFVFLDEPYNGLSPMLIEEVNRLILETSRYKAIVITDHDFWNVFEVSTHLTLMKDGKIHHVKDKSELIEKGYLNQGML